ncbi:DCP2 [Candida theae]|uniref:DCP2 n=1 Tax=Candida theae TaxID=1198502 RepID=A0AAD5BIE5_9ASCO|nr:DCP2 [Candida theae]KAI5964412.1 DCP2 [Candida theae]
MSIQLRDGLLDQSLDRVLEDLLVRFVVNVPEEDLSSIERIFFQVEEAHWFYLDYVRQLDPSLPSMKMKAFASKLLEKCPLIWKWGDPSDALARFGKYKSTIPVRGVALFNKELTKVLLVKGTESNAWSFPRGKISKDESDVDCAVREAEEEIGFNCSELIDKNDYVERTIRGKNYKIFLVKNVSEDIQFEPVSKYEIAQIKWFDIKSVQKKVKSNPNNFFIVATIIKPVMKWISKNKGVMSEEDLMQQAEIKLKKLMGLNKRKENVDAGRELLNILQSAKPTSQVANNHDESANKQADNSGVTPMVNVQLPPHLQHQLPFFTGGAYPNIPFYMQPPANVPGQPPHFPHPGLLPPHQQYHQQIPPNPDSLTRPATHSKELLSILTTKNENKRGEDGGAARTGKADSGNLRSRAQQLMSVFPKRKAPTESKNDKTASGNGVSRSESPISNRSSPSQEIAKTKLELERMGLNKSVPAEKDIPRPLSRQQPSNEIEESIRSSYQRQPAVGQKIKLLKRSDNKDSKDLLNLLKPKNDGTRQDDASDSQQNKEVVNQSQKEAPVEEHDANASLQIEKQPSADRVASQQLLGFLHRQTPSKSHDEASNEKRAGTIANVLNKETRDNDITPRVVSPTRDFLSLLKKPNTTESHDSLSVDSSTWANKSQQQQNKSQSSASANKLLSLFGRNQRDGGKGGINQDIWSSQDKEPSITSPNALSSIQKFDREVGSNQATLSNTVASPVSENWGSSHPESYQQSQQSQQPDISASSALRDILLKNNAQQSSPSLSGVYDSTSGNVSQTPQDQTHPAQKLHQEPNKVDNFDDFEDFEDFDNFNAFNGKYVFDDDSLPKTFTNFDVDSDDEVVGGDSEPKHTQQSHQPYYPSGTFPQHQKQQQQRQQPPGQLDSPTGDKQETVHLAEPNFNLSTSSRSTIGQQDQSNNPGKGLLALLNRGKSTS